MSTLQQYVHPWDFTFILSNGKIEYFLFTPDSRSCDEVVLKKNELDILVFLMRVDSLYESNRSILRDSDYITLRDIYRTNVTVTKHSHEIIIEKNTQDKKVVSKFAELIKGCQPRVIIKGTINHFEFNNISLKIDNKTITLTISNNNSRMIFRRNDYHDLPKNITSIMNFT